MDYGQRCPVAVGVISAWLAETGLREKFVGSSIPSLLMPSPEINEANFVQARVDLALFHSDGIAAAEDKVAPSENDVTEEVSPWLDLTRSPECIRGHGFFEVAEVIL